MHNVVFFLSLFLLLYVKMQKHAVDKTNAGIVFNLQCHNLLSVGRTIELLMLSLALDFIVN